MVRYRYDDYGNPTEIEVEPISPEKHSNFYVAEATAYMTNSDKSKPVKGAEEKAFADTIIQLIAESEMHPLMAFASIMDAIADALTDIRCDVDVKAVKTLAEDIYRSAIW